MIRRLLARFGYARVDWGAACGRVYLTVNDVVVVVQGTVCCDDHSSVGKWSGIGDWTDCKIWDRETIKNLAEGRLP